MNVEAENLWQNIINLRRHGYSIVCALAVILSRTSRSNLRIEHTFNILTNILLSGCLSVNHRRMELILIIHANDKNLNDVEISKIIERTLDIYLKETKKKK